MLTRRLRAPFLLTALALSCGDSSSDDNTRSLPDSADQAVTTYANIVHASYTDSLSAAQAMHTALEALVETPSEQTMNAARQAWLDAREPYLQTEVYRFYAGPIDDDDGPEGLINAWPMEEGYVDYVEGPEGATSGIINDTSITIDAATLEAMNGQGEAGDANVTTGYHAIEFLLWGQDFNDDGPGNRPFTDYVVGEGGTAANQDRRGQYLLVVSEMLQSDLSYLVDAWAPNADNYRAQFEAMDPQQSLGLAVSGAAILAGFETGGERLDAALIAADQEEEHSCFSDNTHRDMIQDIVGIQNVWLGRYQGLTAATTVNGTGFDQVFAAADVDLATRITSQISESLQLAQAMEVPFDQEIVGSNAAGRERVNAVVIALTELQSQLEDEAIPLYDLTKLDPPQ